MAVYCFSFCTSQDPGPILPSRNDDTTRDKPRSDITTPGDEGNPEVSEGESIYVCAVLQKEDGSKELALYKDGSQELSIKCSEENHISEDADSHFLIGSRLFTTFTGRDGTYIGMNGKILCSWEQREYIKSLLWDGSNVWTLGLPLEEKGFCIRKNGIPFFTKKDGTPLSFYFDESDLYASYYTLLADKRITYLVKNDNEAQIKGPNSLEVEDVLIHNGRTCIIERDTDRFLMNYAGNELTLDRQAGFQVINAEAIPYGQEDFTLILHMKSNYSPMPADKICNKDTTILVGAGTACHYYFDDSSWWRLCLTKNADKWYIYNGATDTENILNDIYLPTQRCATIDDGALYLAASYKDTSRQPFVWTDGKTLTYRITGTLTGISISPPM